MIIDLRRTFTEHTDDFADNNDPDWSHFLGQQQGPTTWSDLHKKPLTVVLGEAGIGKTIEFQSEVGRLQAAGMAAFFIPLNQLSEASSWQLALTGRDTEFTDWVAGDQLGYFFLDAVDEARLRSHADFEKALTVVHRALGSSLFRVRIAISSRITDWAIPGVRSAVESHLLKPIERALAAKVPDESPLTSLDLTTVSVPDVGTAPSVSAFVVGLDPLSYSEAHRCATAFGLQDAAQFWLTVEDGDYEFMATRPLDLRWMVVLWNKRKSLGTYLELIEANISNRLCEYNESYEAAGEALSVDQLRTGAIELAAAAEFGGCAFFTLDLGLAPSEGEIIPQTVLTSWEPTAVRRLMATAVFDEASYGRVKFHHRSIREYLAAQWVAEQLALGVPLQRLQGLFAGRPFGEPVLIPARRASLSWLAAMNVEVREWVVREFPEILLYEGDQQAWDGISADKAFANYIEATDRGLQVSWFLSASECMRVGRALGIGKVAAALADASMSPQVRNTCFHIARHAKLHDCSSVAFDIYRNVAAPKWERLRALEVLEVVGTPDQRLAVLADLKSALLSTNEFIAHALPVTNWKQLTEGELSAIFDTTEGEAGYGSGPMARVVKSELMPMSDLPAALLVLGAVMTSLPRPIPGQRFSRYPESDQPKRAWLLDAVADCFERVLALLPETLNSYPMVCLEAAERLEAQRDSGFTDRDEFNRLSKAIVQHPELRWGVALAIAQSEDIRASVHRLTWRANCLVTFESSDLSELTRRANDQARPNDERDIWFALAVQVAFSENRGHERVKALRELVLGGTGSARSVLIRGEYEGLRKGKRHQRKWKSEERERKVADTQALDDFKAKLLANLEQIRSGTHYGWLKSLLHYSYRRSGQSDYSDVNLEEIATSLSPDIAAAFGEGLEAYWPTVTPPEPGAYTNGQVPWAALIALAGLRRSLRDASSISALSGPDVVKAAQFAVWELNTPPPWFDFLAHSHLADVEASLTPWIVAEAQMPLPGNGVRGALEMALRCASDSRRRLLAPLAPLIADGAIKRSETLKTVFNALREDGLLTPATVTLLCQNQLTASIGPNRRIGDMGWLRSWMEEDASAAWLWFQAHLEAVPADIEAEVSAFAEVAGDLKWLKSPLSREAADVVLGMHALLGAHAPTAHVPDDAGDSQFFGPPAKRLREAIPNVFLGTRGQLGHDALVTLLKTITDDTEWNWITGRIAEHAALEVAQTANRSIEELKAIGSPFLSAPRTEAQLYEQVVARLEEIRKNLEEGPFSERDLFKPGMPEKFLQRWLAAKLRETQNRRFSVHREEEVDDDNLTDIQLSCPSGNVCVEIKPVDVGRYSANSLTDTLQTQIVGQYLKGTNSSRGILLLLQLDNKTWSIPGGATGQPFAALVSYLQAQADVIKRSSVAVDELAVFGIRCIV